MRIVRASTETTRTATTMITIRAVIPTSYSLDVDERGCALDLGHLDIRSRLEHLAFVECAGAPDLAADPDPAACGIYPLEDDRTRADERRRAGAQRGRHPQVRPRNRAEDGERRSRCRREDDEIDPPPGAERRSDHCRDGRDGDRPEEEEARREDLADRKCDGDESPEQPGRHSAILDGHRRRLPPSRSA